MVELIGLSIFFVVIYFYEIGLFMMSNVVDVR